MIRTLTFALRRDQASSRAISYYATQQNAAAPHDTPTARPPAISTCPESLRLALSVASARIRCPSRSARPIRATVTTEAQTSAPTVRPAAAPAQLQDATTARPPAVVAAHDRHVDPQRHLQVGVAKPLRPDVQRDLPTISQSLAAECRRLCAPSDRLPLLSLAGIGRVVRKLCHRHFPNTRLFPIHQGSTRARR